MTVPSTEIQTGRLILRPITAADAPALATVYAHPDVSRYLRSLDVDATARQVEGFADEWEQRGYGILSVFHRTTGTFLGRSGLHFWPQLREVEVGWVVRREAWGNGYATEAGAAALDWGFREHGLPAIVAIIARRTEDRWPSPSGCRCRSCARTTSSEGR